MAPPLYFLPGVTHKQLRPAGKLNRSILAAHRLDQVLHDVSPMRVTLSDLHRPGPGDQTGLLLRAEAAAGGVGERFDYLPGVQRWDRVLNGDQVLYWIGTDHASPVKPADVVRVRPIRGELVQMADGQHWQAPLIRRPNPRGGPPVSGLPTETHFNLDRTSIEMVQSEYADIWQRSARVFDVVWLGSELQPGEEVDLTRFALDAIALNYRIGPAEANLLRIFKDSEVARAVVEAAVGVSLLDELQKKSEPAA